MTSNKGELLALASDECDLVSFTSKPSCVSRSVDGTDSSEEQQVSLRRKRPRRSVHFEEDVNREVKRRVLEVESVLNLVEKSYLWVQPCEMAETMYSIQEESLLLRVNEATFGAYVDNLAETYCICCVENDGDDEEAAAAVTPAHISLLGLARGMEPFSLPELAVARGQRRRHGIQSLVHLDTLLRHDSQRNAMLGAVSEYLSVSATRFAQALGAADAVTAIALLNDEHVEATEPPAAAVLVAHTQ